MNCESFEIEDLTTGVGGFWVRIDGVDGRIGPYPNVAFTESVAKSILKEEATIRRF